MRRELDQPVISPKYHTVVKESLGAQMIVALLSVLLLDGGIAARVVGAAMLAFWPCAALLTIRRPFDPTYADLAFIRWGYWCVLAFAILVQNSG